MRYRPEILDLYASIFDDTHAQLVKEAAGKEVMSRLQRMGAWLAKGKAGRAAEKATARETQRVGYSPENAAFLAGVKERAPALMSENQRLTEALAATGGTAEGVKSLQRRAGIGTALGVGGLAAAPLAYMGGKSLGEQNKNRTRNLAFGAGTATGLAIPHVVRGLGNIAYNAGNTGLFPELQSSLVDAGMGNGTPYGQ